MSQVLYYSEFDFHGKWFCIITTGNFNTYLTESFRDDLFTFPLKISPINPAGLTCVMILSCLALMMTSHFRHAGERFS